MQLLKEEKELIAEALRRAAKRQESEARWHSTRKNMEAAKLHTAKAVAMFKLVALFQPVKGLRT